MQRHATTWINLQHSMLIEKARYNDRILSDSTHMKFPEYVNPQRKKGDW